MEGPTPVSALIHAATMVTAGIFLMLRLSSLFLINTNFLNFVAIVGALTALFGATTGTAQTDIKKIIAFSTCSQLGYMVAACGLGQFNLAFFHLITHAFFKSLLFLSAGVVIHTLGGEQDIRKMGGLIKVLPITFTAIVIASWALSGIPFLSGYYSKELIISSALLQNTWLGFFVALLLITSAIFTSAYSAKLIYYVFISKPRGTLGISLNLHQEDSENIKYFQTIPLCVLSIFSIFGGFLFKDMLAGPGANTTLSSFSEFSINNSSILWVEFLPISVKILLCFSSISGYVFYALVNKRYIDINLLFNKNIKMQIVYSFFYNRWYIDFIISYFINFFTLFVWEELNVYYMQAKLLDLLTVKLVIGIVSSLNSTFTELATNTPYQYIRLTYVAMLVIFLITNVAVDIIEFS